MKLLIDRNWYKGTNMYAFRRAAKAQRALKMALIAALKPLLDPVFVLILKIIKGVSK